MPHQRLKHQHAIHLHGLADNPQRVGHPQIERLRL